MKEYALSKYHHALSSFYVSMIDFCAFVIKLHLNIKYIIFIIQKNDKCENPIISIISWDDIYFTEVELLTAN